MKKIFFVLFAFGALMVSCGENETKDEGTKDDNMETKDTAKEQQTEQKTEDTTRLPGVVMSEVAKEKGKESASKCWWCGDYNMLTPPTNGAQPLPSPQRICGPTWNSCPTFTTLGDGSVWQFSGGCRCDG